jgi:hypothetical protein
MHQVTAAVRCPSGRDVRRGAALRSSEVAQTINDCPRANIASFASGNFVCGPLRCDRLFQMPD